MCAAVPRPLCLSSLSAAFGQPPHGRSTDRPTRFLRNPSSALRRAVSTCSTSTCAYRDCGAGSLTLRHMLPLLTVVVVVLVVSTASTLGDNNNSNAQQLLGSKPWFDSDCSDPRYRKVRLFSPSFTSSCLPSIPPVYVAFTSYFVHFFRISNVASKLVSETARILDVCVFFDSWNFFGIDITLSLASRNSARKYCEIASSLCALATTITRSANRLEAICIERDISASGLCTIVLASSRNHFQRAELTRLNCAENTASSIVKVGLRVLMYRGRGGSRRKAADMRIPGWLRKLSVGF